MVPPASHKIARVSWYSGSFPPYCPRPLRDSHPLWWHVPMPSSKVSMVLMEVLQPRHLRRDDGLGSVPVRSPLLRESRLISLAQATEMFQFAHDPPHRLCVQRWVFRHDSEGVAPLGISGIIAWMQLPLNVSPVSASFIGLQRQGIHLVLSVACSALFFFCRR